jgi:hypothetical protein
MLVERAGCLFVPEPNPNLRGGDFSWKEKFRFRIATALCTGGAVEQIGRLLLRR